MGVLCTGVGVLRTTFLKRPLRSKKCFPAYFIKNTEYRPKNFPGRAWLYHWPCMVISLAVHGYITGRAWLYHWPCMVISLAVHGYIHNLRQVHLQSLRDGFHKNDEHKKCGQGVSQVNDTNLRLVKGGHNRGKSLFLKAIYSLNSQLMSSGGSKGGGEVYPPPPLRKKIIILFRGYLMIW